MPKDTQGQRQHKGGDQETVYQPVRKCSRDPKYSSIEVYSLDHSGMNVS
jgi:hypothetical protein